MIKREIEENLSALLNKQATHSNVIIVEGARQVGKTVLIEQVLKKKDNVTSINLEKDKLFLEKLDATKSFAQFEKLLQVEKGFSTSGNPVLFIDEAQESDVLGRYVRSMKEDWENVKCILTGSSMTRLFRKDTRIPVGRLDRLKVNPFNFTEFLAARDKSALLEAIADFPRTLEIIDVLHNACLQELDEYLKIGGLPQVVITYNNGGNYQNTRRAILLDQQEDLIRKELFEKNHLFMDALRAVANHLGTTSTYSHVSEKISEAKKILSVMVGWHLILEVEQKGLSSTTNFHPKRYLYDIGIAQEVRNMPFPNISLLQTVDSILRTALGGLVENLVLLSLQSSEMINISSWKKSSKETVEVDLIWRDEFPIPIECKSALHVTNRTFTNVRNYLSLINGKVGFVVSCAPYERFRENGRTLINLPGYLATPQIVRSLAGRYG